MHEIVLPQSLHDKLRQHLLQDFNMEQAAFILAGVSENANHTRLLAREMIPVPPQEFTQQGSAFLSVREDFSRAILHRCLAENLSLIETHSHPFCEDRVTFSSIDMANEKEKFSYVAGKIPGIFHATMVWGQRSIDAHIWERRTSKVVPIQRIQIPGNPFQNVVPTSSQITSGQLFKESRHLWRTKHHSSLDPFNRQVLAFGIDGQRKLESATVGIAGAGGIGSAVLELLVRLGVKNIVVADMDNVEITNLNRMFGSHPADALRKSSKVEVLKRHAQRINPKVKVSALKGSVLEPTIQSQFKSCDVIFGCTDNHSSRLALNLYAVQYMIPFIDIGTGIQANGTGQVTAAGGQVRIVLPGNFCLECIAGIDHEQAGQELLSPLEQAQRIAHGYVTGADITAPSVVFLNMTLASIAIGELMAMLTGFKAVQSLLMYDLMKNQITAAAAHRRTDCICCGDNATAGLGDLATFDLTPRNLPKIPGVEQGETTNGTTNSTKFIRPEN